MNIVRRTRWRVTFLCASAALFTLCPSLNLQAQERSSATGAELSVGVLKAFYSDKSEGPESSFGAADAVQALLKVHTNGPLSAVGIEFTFLPDGWWAWPWPWDHSLPMDHDGGIRVTLNGFVNLAESGALSFDGVVGAGIRRWGEGDGEIEFSPRIPSSEIYRIQSDIDPVVIYGVVADYALGDRVSVQANARGVTTFGGDLEVKDASGASTTIEDRRQSFVNVGVGIGVRLGSGR